MQDSESPTRPFPSPEIRASINLMINPDFDEEYLRKASTATCHCRHTIDLGVLIVRNDEVWAIETGEEENA